MAKVAATWCSFFAFAFIARLPVFGVSVVDHDESLYMIIGRDVLNGQLPFLHTFDHKPPFLYYLFAAFQLVFGATVQAGRMLAVACVATTASALVACAARLGWAKHGYAAGILYVLFSLANGGLASNNEITFAPFVVLCLYAGLRAVAPGARALWPALAGVAAGAALGIKFVTAFDLLGVTALVLASASERRELSLAHLGRAAAVAVVSAGATLTLTLLPHLVAGHDGLLYESLIAYNRAYSGFDIGSDALRWSLVSAQGFLGGTVLVAATIYFALKQRAGRLVALALLAWLLLAIASVVLMGRYFPHHFLQTLPALSLMGALLFDRLPPLKLPLSPKLVVAVLALALGAVGSLRDMRAPVRELVKPILGLAPPVPDVPREIAKVLAEKRARADETLFVYNYHPIIYYLTGAPRPTRFAFSDFLASDYPLSALGTTADAEVERIAASAPDWVVFQSPRPAFHNEQRWELVKAWLDRYEVVASWPIEGGAASVALLRSSRLSKR